MRCSYSAGVTEKIYRERKLGDSVGDCRAGGCAASRELRITCVAFGIRNHPRERIADRHGAYRPALPGFGAVEEPEDLPYRLPLPFAVLSWSRNPSSSSEIEPNYRYRTVKEYRKVLLQIIAEQPLSAERREVREVESQRKQNFLLILAGRRSFIGVDWRRFDDDVASAGRFDQRRL
ncbi:hypothetical protein GEV33_004598 [Tenebrio molitor]|uniref:Uncharacterized protein n=1 Tax=Tenebrio molitor TaxID=7067 RepID=A0A8J6HMX6_TENMO|nr:hypothetical protein GEV33_004598 [Tenebrio molitor]